MKRYILLLLALLILIPSGCIRKPTEEMPDSEKELDHLIILELFYSGSIKERKWGKRTYYYHDGANTYIKLHNPTKEVKYLDGLAIASTAFYSNNPVEFDIPEQNFMAERTAVQKVMHFPGSGQTYPIQPGETKLLVAVAVDHTKDQGWDPDWEEYSVTANPHSFDMTVADFEWLTVEDIQATDYEDNPEVPNLEKSYMEIGFTGNEFKVTHNQGFLLINFPKEEFAKDKIAEHFRKFEYTFIQGDTPNKTEGNVMTIPNSSIIDAVVVCPNESYAFGPVHESIDAGWKGVSAYYQGSSRPENRTDLNKAIRRLYDGKKWVDTNNSLMDFDIFDASNSKDYSNPEVTNPFEPDWSEL